MTQRRVYFNGEFVPEAEARVSIFDSALMYGDMVFEMARSFNGKPFRVRQHLERLYTGLKILKIDCGLTLYEMEAATHQTIEINQRAFQANAIDVPAGVVAVEPAGEETVVMDGNPVAARRFAMTGDASPSGSAIRSARSRSSTPSAIRRRSSSAPRCSPQRTSTSTCQRDRASASWAAPVRARRRS